MIRLGENQFTRDNFFLNLADYIHQELDEVYRVAKITKKRLKSKSCSHSIDSTSDINSVDSFLKSYDIKEIGKNVAAERPFPLPRLCSLNRSRHERSFGLIIKIDAYFNGALIVEHVVKKSLADIANLRKNEIIIEINGRNMDAFNSFFSQVNFLKKAFKQEKVEILVLSDIEAIWYYYTRNIRVNRSFITVDSFPRPRLCLLRRWPNYCGGFGISLLEELKSSFILIDKVDGNGPAFAGGIRYDDVIIEVNGNKLEFKKFFDLLDLLKEAFNQNEIELLVVKKSEAIWFKKHDIKVNKNLPNLNYHETPFYGHILKHLRSLSQEKIPAEDIRLFPLPRVVSLAKTKQENSFGFQLNEGIN